MSAQHTPGPWRAVFGEVAAVVGADAGRVAIATNLSLDARRDGNEVEANARLIAAAPELLEALEQSLAQIQEFKTRWMRLPPFADKLNRTTREGMTVAHMPVMQAEELVRAAIQKATGEPA